MSDEPIFRRVLLGIDGSLPSIIAQDLTVFLAKKLDSEVTILKVISHEFTSFQPEKYNSVLISYVPLGTRGPHGPEEDDPRVTASEAQEALSRELTASHVQ